MYSKEKNSSIELFEDKNLKMLVVAMRMMTIAVMVMNTYEHKNKNKGA